MNISMEYHSNSKWLLGILHGTGTVYSHSLLGTFHKNIKNRFAGSGQGTASEGLSVCLSICKYEKYVARSRIALAPEMHTDVPLPSTSPSGLKSIIVTYEIAQTLFFLSLEDEFGNSAFIWLT